jgi:hypothetical protein
MAKDVHIFKITEKEVKDCIRSSRFTLPCVACSNTGCRRAGTTLQPAALYVVPGAKDSSSWREAAWAGPEVRKRHSLTGSF